MLFRDDKTLFPKQIRKNYTDTSQAISDLVRDIKSNSSTFITNQKFVKGKFHWQEGFGAFTYSHSHIDKVVKYIANQEEHHRTKTFEKEYLEFLKKFNVEYNEKYLFDWIEDI